MERKAQLKAIAQRLVQARKERSVIDFLGGADGPAEEAEAYAIQFAKHEMLVKAGETLAGWKVAASIPAQYQPLGLTGPALGGLFKSNLVKSGARFPAGGSASLLRTVWTKRSYRPEPIRQPMRSSTSRCRVPPG